MIKPGCKRKETEAIAHVNQALNAPSYAANVRGDRGREKHPAEIPETLHPLHQLL